MFCFWALRKVCFSTPWTFCLLSYSACLLPACCYLPASCLPSAWLLTLRLRLHMQHNKKGTCNNVLSLGLPVYCNHSRCSIELSLEAPVNEAWAPSDCRCSARGVWRTQANNEPLICSARVLYNGCYSKAQKSNFLRGWPLKARYLQ